MSETLKSARARLADWIGEADPVIAASEQLAQEAADLDAIARRVAERRRTICPDLNLLAGAGPKLQVRLLALPAGTLLREIPALVLVQAVADAGAELCPGRRPPADDRRDRSAACRLERAHRAAAVVAAATHERGAQRPSPSGSRSSSQAARRTDRAHLARCPSRLSIARALGDIALIEWLNDHAKDLRGSERLAWVTGWTSDVTGARLRRALDACDVRYILRFAEAPAGMTPRRWC